jgi:hypothetical protein
MPVPYILSTSAASGLSQMHCYWSGRGPGRYRKRGFASRSIVLCKGRFELVRKLKLQMTL